MKRWMAGCLVLAVLLAVALAPDAADARGRFHRGGVHVGIWGPGLFVGGLALGAAIAAPYRYYPSYYPPYYYYPPDYYYAPPPTVIYQQVPTTYVAPAPVQREVVYPHGKYVLYGDGVTQAWQWVWVPNAPANPPPPPPTR